MVDRLARVPRHQRKSARGVDGVVDRRRAVAVADQPQHDEVRAGALERREIETS